MYKLIYEEAKKRYYVGIATNDEEVREVKVRVPHVEIDENMSVVDLRRLTCKREWVTVATGASMLFDENAEEENKTGRLPKRPASYCEELYLTVQEVFTIEKIKVHAKARYEAEQADVTTRKIEALKAQLAALGVHVD